MQTVFIYTFLIQTPCHLFIYTAYLFTQSSVYACHTTNTLLALVLRLRSDLNEQIIEMFAMPAYLFFQQQ